MRTQINRVILALVVFGIAGFCIITNSSGIFRSYRSSDLPFIIQLNESVPSEWIPVIEEGMSRWNDLESAYFEFELGANTPANSPGLDNINLLYFDQVGDNFSPGTNVIAFSRTFTSNSGGYHAVESDYIFNARYFPPSITGQPGQQDLMSVTVHEIGHHLGLDHTGLPSGASSGCGTLVQPATMWWSSASGDTSKRSLHLHDIAGVSAIYPNWLVQGNVTDIDDGAPLGSSEIVFVGTYGAAYSPVENPIGNRYARPGDPFTSVNSDSDGSYSVAVLDKTFELGAERFGYYGDTVQIQFTDVVGFGNTQTKVTDFALQKKPSVTLSGSITDINSGAGIVADIAVTWVKDAEPLEVLTTNSNGEYSFDVFADGFYNLEIFFNPPYQNGYKLDSIYVDSDGEIVSLSFEPVSVFVMFADSSASVRANVITAVEKAGNKYTSWQVNEINGLPSPALLDSFTQPLALFWLGGEETSAISQQTSDLFITHLQSSNRLFVAGRNLAENADSGDIFLEEYAGIQFVDNSVALKTNGFENDLIGDSLSSITPGAGKDILNRSVANIGTVSGVFYYGNETENLAAVRSENPDQNWKVIYFAYGLEQMLSNSIADSVIVRSLNYLLDTNFVVAVENDIPGNSIPQSYSLFQNYPNPFNPSTIINYSLAQETFVELKIFNLLGEEVKSLVNKNQPQGNYSVTWKGENNYGSKVSAGIYFFKIKAGNFVESKKMVLLK